MSCGQNIEKRQVLKCQGVKVSKSPKKPCFATCRLVNQPHNFQSSAGPTLVSMLGQACFSRLVFKELVLTGNPTQRRPRCEGPLSFAQIRNPHRTLGPWRLATLVATLGSQEMCTFVGEGGHGIV